MFKALFYLSLIIECLMDYFRFFVIWAMKIEVLVLVLKIEIFVLVLKNQVCIYLFLYCFED